MQNVSSVREFLSMKWFTKGEIFTFCFNFDLNRRASKEKMGSKCLFFSLFKKRFPLVNDKMNSGSQGEV